jgi:ATP-binding cassette subfamily B (MDR/TAP) protein 1
LLPFSSLFPSSSYFTTTTGSFLIMYIILTLYGTYTIYKDVSSTGCDPSAGVQTNTTCKSSGPAVFGAMLGT